METAITVFCQFYAPCTMQVATDFFTTNEIKLMIETHLGETLDTAAVAKMLTDLLFTYTLEDGEFVWLMLRK